MKHAWISACVACAVMGCDQGEPPTPKVSTPVGAATAAPSAPQPNTAMLEYQTRIETRDGKSTVYWTAQVPTGGWTMSLDQPPLVEESNTLWWVRVWTTITAPNPADMVSQGFVTLEGKFEADRKIDRVEFSARRKTAGVETVGEPMYAVVKTGPAHVTQEDKPSP